METVSSLRTIHIAPCGMNCGVCIGHMRLKNKCSGCNVVTGPRLNHCTTCSIRNCVHLKDKFCYTCAHYPCKRLKQLDKRYRNRYGVSLINNLEEIKSTGIRNFINEEKKKWECTSCGKKLSIHRKDCIYCGSPANRLMPEPI